MESAHLKYVNRHDYQLLQKMPLEVIFSQNQTNLCHVRYLCLILYITFCIYYPEYILGYIFPNKTKLTKGYYSKYEYRWK